MLGFINRWRNDQARAAQTVAEQYRQLITKAATTEDLSSAEEQALRTVIQKLGKTDDMVLADVAVMKEYYETEAAAKTKAEAHKRVREIIAEQTKLEAEILLTNGRFEETRKELASHRGNAGVAHMSAAAAASKLQDMQRRHWALLGLADPAAAEPQKQKTPEEFGRELSDVDEDAIRNSGIATANARRIADAEAAARRRAGEAVVQNVEVSEDPATRAARLRAEKAKRDAGIADAVRWSINQDENAPTHR